MKNNQNKIIQQHFLAQLSNQFSFFEDEDDEMLMLQVPFIFHDHDWFTLYLEKINSSNKIRISDKGDIMMRLSISGNNLDKGVMHYFKEHQGHEMNHILDLHKVKENDGNFYIDVDVGDIAKGVFRLSQALGEIHGLELMDKP